MSNNDNIKNVNPWLEFLKKYKMKHVDKKYSEILAMASKSPEWKRYKAKHDLKPKKIRVKVKMKNDCGCKCSCSSEKYKKKNKSKPLIDQL